MDKFLAGIPWTSATVQTLVSGIVAAWVTHFSGGPISLKEAIVATIAGAAGIYARRAMVPADVPAVKS